MFDGPSEEPCGDGGGQHVVVAQEACADGVGGRIGDVASVAGLAELAGVKDRDAVADGGGFPVVVRDEQRCRSAGGEPSRRSASSLRSRRGIECSEGFVEQEQAWFQRECACEAGALRLAT